MGEGVFEVGFREAKLGDQLATQKANGPVIVYIAAQDTFRLGDDQGREVTAAELKSAKIFQLEYRDPWASPTAKAPQIERAMQRIAQATGEGGLDVIAHSAGGTDFVTQRHAASSSTLIAVSTSDTSNPPWKRSRASSRP